MKTYRHYITGSLIFGVSTGMVSLLARWISGNAILSSPESLIKYGLLGGIGYSLAGALSIFLFGILAGPIRDRFPTLETIGDLFHLRLRSDGYWFMSILIFLLGFDSLFMQAVGAAVLFNLLFNFPFTLSLSFFFLYCFLVAGLGGMKWIQKFEGISIFFIFSAVILIPLYFFLQEGAYEIYNGIRLYHPYLLFINNHATYLFILTFALVGFGQVITDRSTWQRLYMIEKKKVRITFWSTALVWSTVPIALSAMLLIVLFDGTFNESYSLLFLLINKIKPIFLILLFFLLCFSILSTTIQAELHATTVHFVKHILKSKTPLKTDQTLRRESYWVSGIILLLLLIFTHFLDLGLLEFLFFIGSIYVACIPVILIVILSKRTPPRLLPYSIVLGWIISKFLIQESDPLKTIWYSFFCTSFFAVSFLLLQKKEAQRNTPLSK